MSRRYKHCDCTRASGKCKPQGSMEMSSGLWSSLLSYLHFRLRPRLSLRELYFPGPTTFGLFFCKDGNQFNPARGINRIIYFAAPYLRIVSSSCSSEPRLRSCELLSHTQKKKHDKPSYRNPTGQRLLAGVTRFPSLPLGRMSYPAYLPQCTANGKR